MDEDAATAGRKLPANIEALRQQQENAHLGLLTSLKQAEGYTSSPLTPHRTNTHPARTRPHTTPTARTPTPTNPQPHRCLSRHATQPGR